MMPRTMRRPRKRSVILLSTAGFVLLGGYFGCFHRYTAHAEQAGWVVDFAYLPLRCRFCTGRVKRLTCNGQPLALPRSAATEQQSFVVYAPS
jgi:hypothetical protein